MQLVYVLIISSPTGSVLRVFDTLQSMDDFLWMGEASRQYPNCNYTPKQYEVESFVGKL